MLPGVYGGGVDRPEKGDKPLVQWAAFDGNKSHTDANSDTEDGEGIFEKERERRTPESETQNDTNGKLEELFQGHVTDETEFVVGDVLGYGMLLDGHLWLILAHLRR